MQFIPYSDFDKTAGINLAAIKFDGLQAFKKNLIRNLFEGLSIQEGGGMRVHIGDLS